MNFGIVPSTRSSNPQQGEMSMKQLADTLQVFAELKPEAYQKALKDGQDTCNRFQADSKIMTQFERLETPTTKKALPSKG